MFLDAISVFRPHDGSMPGRPRSVSMRAPEVTARRGAVR